ncbi:hypothetical protein IH970_14045 [candidate division KSB1 bacterium]|nr:hypothetical protein [candidate division KSB1 bacterium]
MKEKLQLLLSHLKQKNKKCGTKERHYSLFKRFDLKPKDQSKITLFANKAEAIVFWLCITGLVFLGIVSFFRYLGNRQSVANKKFREELLIRVQVLEEQNQAIRGQTDSLQTELQNLKIDMNTK